ncbi:hypothetical protein NP233_g4176 [Leucocoprinus birnbaumii]|uniref:Uncharacterized protein n=1 Tax=Leucocoprinus birnbaumii TaxID=56174 RepID=A0AAD5YS41_9AGAR|nr:hypothetical protein NP233_g4176 [Leucocoprinus birnbaumii]
MRVVGPISSTRSAEKSSRPRSINMITPGRRNSTERAWSRFKKGGIITTVVPHSPSLFPTTLVLSILPIPHVLSYHNSTTTLCLLSPMKIPPGADFTETDPNSRILTPLPTSDTCLVRAQSLKSTYHLTIGPLTTYHLMFCRLQTRFHTLKVWYQPLLKLAHGREDVTASGSRAAWGQKVSTQYLRVYDASSFSFGGNMFIVQLFHHGQRVTVLINALKKRIVPAETKKLPGQILSLRVKSWVQLSRLVLFLTQRASWADP